MALRRSFLLALLAAGAFLAAGPARVRADDTSIFKDWKEVEKKGKAVVKERAEFWAAKSVTGKDLFWLARLWDAAGEDGKAIEVYEQYLKVPVPELGEKNNREPAMWNVVKIHLKQKEWEKAIPAVERHQLTFPESEVRHESFDKLGRAHRMLGNLDKAAAAFATSADLGFVAGVINLADLLASQDKVDEATAALTKYIAAFEEQPSRQKGLKSLVSVKEMYTVVGKPAPSLEAAASVGREEAPKELKEKPSVLVFWHMSWPGSDPTLTTASQYQERVFKDAVRVVAVGTYNKFNPGSRKIEEGLSAEDEAKLWKTYLEQAPNGAPTLAVVVPADTIKAFGFDQPGQMVVVDAEGVIRYVRPFDTGDLPFTWLCVRAYLEKNASK